MACPQIITGDQFVVRTLTHIDCQAQYLGSYGYQSLGQPGSPAAILVTGLLTLFIALWGFRLLFGPVPAARDIVVDVLKIGIVLTLAFSWPAFRTVIYDVVIQSPAEIASSVSNPGLPLMQVNFTNRLQNVDDAIVSLTEVGTGRQTGQYIDGAQSGGTFAGSAMEDESALGWARLVLLASLIGTLALIRIATGLLLSIAPLVAGLFLFQATRGLFQGWARGLVLTLLASLGIGIVISVELAVLEPWLADALRVRSLGYATPSAPTELFAMTLGFSLVQFGMIWLLARVAFQTGVPNFIHMVTSQPVERQSVVREHALHEKVSESRRVDRLADQMRVRMQREEYNNSSRMGQSPSGRRLSNSTSKGWADSLRPTSARGSRTRQSSSLSSGRRDDFR